MKRIILLSIMLSIAGIANAATFEWQASGLYTYSSTSASLTSYNGVVSLYAIIDGASTLVDTYTTTNGKVNILSDDADFTISSVTDETHPTLDFFFTYESEGYTFTSNQKTDVTVYKDATGSVKFGTVNTYSGGGTWASSAVPEPTSGLLLLLGMAGLALRRKRA